MFFNSRSSRFFFLLPFLGIFSTPSYASSGIEGASFLDIPVGAAPAALGGAYTARAENVYGTVWNPAGLGFVQTPELAGQHLSYIDSVNDEYLGFVVPLLKTSALGGSAQYLTSGDVTGRNDAGDLTPNFSNSYGAYALTYGQRVTPRWSIGVSGKWVHAKLSDVSANAYAGDIGTLYRMTDHVTLAGTVTNLGSSLTFLDQPDALPTAAHASLYFHPRAPWNVSMEGVYRRTGLASFHTGVEWKPLLFLALRAGYRTDTIKESSPLAGLTTGFGLTLWGSELAYAWLPLGDLGNTQYLSVVLHWSGSSDQEKKNLVQFQNIQRYRSAGNFPNPYLEEAPENPADDQLIQLLSEDETVHVSLSPQGVMR